MLATMSAALSSAATMIGAASERPSPSIIAPARSGPSAKPIGAAALKRAIDLVRACSGETSRIVASITPVLPSQKPSASVAPISCHASCAKAKAMSATRAIKPLRTMTSRRDRNSAIASQIGTCGAPTMKMPAVAAPDTVAISLSGTPAPSSASGR